ncbi:MAG: hypothetical protein WCK37_04130 [Candidatus Falkowbacteria bacterium]
MKKQFGVFLAVAFMVVFIPAHQSRAAESSTKLNGRILLQVESHGEAWYVNPKDSKRYYMADGSSAYKIMRNLGVGIANKDLDKIKADKNFAKKNQGKIFLQVESHGEAYYIDINGNAHYLKDGAAAYGIMRDLGLGIKNSDLGKITSSATGLQLVLKDFGMPDVHYLQPTIKEIELKNVAGVWVKIWSSATGTAVRLTPDGAETTLDTVSVPAGTYNGTRLFVSTMDVGVDVNRDGDILDKNVQTILTVAEFNALPAKERPNAPMSPLASSTSITTTTLSVSGSKDSGKDKPSKPSEPSAPSEPAAPYTIKDGYVYLPEYQDEEHTDTINNYIIPQFPSSFVYDGGAGKIVYDFTLHPLLPRGQHISIEASVSTSTPE